jgi:hypothetical protein
MTAITVKRKGTSRVTVTKRRLMLLQSAALDKLHLHRLLTLCLLLQMLCNLEETPLRMD